MTERDADIVRITAPYNMRDPRRGTFSFDVAAVAHLAVESRDREDLLRGAVGQVVQAATEYLESGTPKRRARLETLIKRDPS